MNETKVNKTYQIYKTLKRFSTIRKHNLLMGNCQDKHHPSNSTGIPRKHPLLIPQRPVVQQVILQVCFRLPLGTLGAVLILKSGIATAEEVAIDTLAEHLHAEWATQRMVLRIGPDVVSAWTRKM